MISAKTDLILNELAEGTGAAISGHIDRSGVQSGLKIWFADLDEHHGPIAELRPYGLKGHRVELTFGRYSKSTINQIKSASPEDVQLARALISSIDKNIKLDISEGDSDWFVKDGSFRITATVRELQDPHDDNVIIGTCHNVIVPVMAAMAELIGYDVIEETCEDIPAFEGAILQSLVHRRERNPRNRLLCIRIHGDKCKVCGLEPSLVYGVAGSIIEVHHIEPVGLLENPRPYDPRVDLVPLCPNCHRAVHTRRPIPIGIDELMALIGKGS